MLPDWSRENTLMTSNRSSSRMVGHPYLGITSGLLVTRPQVEGDIAACQLSPRSRSRTTDRVTRRARIDGTVGALRSRRHSSSDAMH
jgi:hypothetical protein